MSFEFFIFYVSTISHVVLQAGVTHTLILFLFLFFQRHDATTSSRILFC
eukprot:SAG11_NODE_17569_length_514_cov_1.677108_2_plen_48_part_01